MPVFKINDYDWYMAPTLDAALDEAARLTEIPREEIAEVSEIYGGFELSDEEMQTLTFRDDDGTRRSFAEEYAIRVAEGRTTECFASELV